MADAYSKLHLDFTDDGTLKVITEGTLSLQKQVRALRQELTLPIYTDAQKQQIRLALQEAEIGLQKTKTQSKELFSQLSLLPGPVGTFFQETQNVMILLRGLSQMKFSDLRNEFSLLTKSFNPESISNAQNVVVEKGAKGAAKEGVTAAGTAAGNTFSTAAGAAIGVNAKDAISSLTATINENQSVLKLYPKLYEDGAVTVTQYLQASNAASESIKNFTKEQISHFANIGRLLSAEHQLQKQFENSNIVIDEGIIKFSNNDAALQTLTKSQIEAAAAGKLFVIAENDTIRQATRLELVVLAVGRAFKGASYSIQDAAAWVAKFSGALVGAGLLAALVAIGGAILAWKKADDELILSEKQLQQEIEKTSKLLELDAKDAERRNAKREAEMKARNASNKQLNKENYEDARDNFKLINDAAVKAAEDLNKAFEQNQNLGKNSWFTRTFGVSKEAADLSSENIKKATDALNKIQQEQKDAETKIYQTGNAAKEEIMRRAYQNSLRDLDARIALEIGSEETSSATLAALYKKRNELIDNYNVNINLSEKERLERRKQQRQTAINEEVNDEVKKKNQLIDAQKRQTEELSLNTQEYFDARKKIVTLEFEKEMIEAKKFDDDTKGRQNAEQNARTKQYIGLRAIDVEQANFKVALAEKEFNAELQRSDKFFQKQREALKAKYDADVLAARGNYEMLLALDKEYQKKKKEIDVDQAKDGIENRKQQNERLVTLVKMVGIDLNKNWFDMRKQEDAFDKKFYEGKRATLIEEYNNEKQLSEEGSEQRKALDIKYANESLQITKDELENKRKLRFLEVEWATQIADILTTLGNVFFKNNKDLMHALVAIQGAAQIAKIIATTEAGLAAATAEAAAVALIPGVGELAMAKLAAVQTATRISEAISIAAVVAAQAAAWQQIDSGGSGGGGGGGGADRIVRGKNYGQGGMIKGESHANGGVPATLEGGEAVMTKNSVSMFGPLLSMMNQAGGGVAFSKGAIGQAPFDNPHVVGGPSEPQIIKTYVVESELTTNQQKQARLKSLSTL
ncbi:hypothetical protein UFOVP185_38 [uncultured Caudovirales phage]|uniref:Uncharacterized protein n=1 Tax=uncultured Caudovirales phage TaxID=2100421 RepID=A0A6J7WJQ3_9CAUD|nr:hypothetical protein UFOVP185_38 [uncultured Caudovirales phage]